MPAPKTRALSPGAAMPAPKTRALTPVVPGDESSSANTPSGALEGELLPAGAQVDEGSAAPVIEPVADSDPVIEAPAIDVQAQLDTLATERAALNEAQAAFAAEKREFEAERAQWQRSPLAQAPAAKDKTDAEAQRAARANATDWSKRSSDEARKAGVTKPVMCADGMYVPETFGTAAKV